MPKNIVKRAADFCVTPKFERIFDKFARYVAYSCKLVLVYSA
jgi:hypothetical protein